MKSKLFSFKVSSLFCWGNISCFTYVVRFSVVLEKSVISSRCTKADGHSTRTHIISIAIRNVLGAFFSPNIIRANRNGRWRYLKAVLRLSLLSISATLFPLLALNLEKRVNSPIVLIQLSIWDTSLPEIMRLVFCSEYRSVTYRLYSMQKNGTGQLVVAGSVGSRWTRRANLSLWRLRTLDLG